MGIKLIFEHGRLFGEDSPYGIKVIAINQDNKNYCDVVNAFPFLSKLNSDELDSLFNTLSQNIEAVSLGTIDTSHGISYVEPISESIREQYKDFF